MKLTALVSKLWPRKWPATGEATMDYKYGTSRLTVRGTDASQYRIVMLAGLQEIGVITATYSTRCEAQAALNTRAKNMRLEPWRG